MALPNNALSSIPIPAAFNPPRTSLRDTAASGLSDSHMGGIAIGDPSHGLAYQLWTIFAQGGGIWISSPNTPSYEILPNTPAIWVALAFNQNSQPFIAWVVNNTGTAFYYWYDSTISNYRTSTLTGPLAQVFATLDDQRSIEIANSDIILAYIRGTTLYVRQERERFGTEYTLGTAPSSRMIQLGMNSIPRLQFAFLSPGATGAVFKPVLVADVNGIKPRIWVPIQSNTVRTKQ
jgi:hypothetical protein